MPFETIFGTEPNLSWWQECARGALIFVYGLLAFRLAGRRAFAKWSALDIVVSIVVGSSLSRALTGSAELWGTLAATTLFLLLHGLTSHAAALSPSLSHLIEGRSIQLGEGGGIDKKALLAHAVSEADLTEALHSAGIDAVGDTRRIVLSPNGKLAALRRWQN